MSRSIRKRSESRDILFGNHPSDMAQLFEGLDAVLHLYEKALDGEDRLIWWTERTLVSALTQAAMRCRWPAAAEYQDRKRAARRHHRTHRGQPRTDLWVRPPNVADGWAIEAKYDQPALNADGMLVVRKATKSAWRSAIRDAARVKKAPLRQNERPYAEVWGVLLIAPYTRARKVDPDDGSPPWSQRTWSTWATTACRQLQAELWSPAEPTFVRFSPSRFYAKPTRFPQQGKRLITHERFWPGLFLVARPVDG